MQRLNTHSGKFQLGGLEVTAEPIYVGLEVVMVLEGNVQIATDQIADSIVTSYYDKGIDLFSTNSYRSFMTKKEVIPEEEVLDGKLPGQVRYHLTFDFYRSRPVKELKK